MANLLRKKTFLNFFPVPEYLLLSTAGIVITDDDTKFVELHRKLFKEEFKLARFNKQENPPGAVESGLVNDPGKLAPVLKAIVPGRSIRYVHATLPEEKAYLFTVSVNRVSAGELKDAVASIIEENVPVSLAESVFDLEVIEESSSESEAKLAVSVLPKNIVNSYAALLESAGLTPVSFDIESRAIARAIIPRGSRESTLIINLGRKRTGFYVVENGVVQFSTTPAYGIGGDDSYPSIPDLKAEMRKVFAFWDARSGESPGGQGKKIGKILLCGAGANRKDFIDKFLSESSVPYAPADVQANFPSFGRRDSKMSLDESLDYCSAIGLVLPHH